MSTHIYSYAPYGGYGIFIESLDSSGNFRWVSCVDGTGWDKGNALTTDLFGNVYITGQFEISYVNNVDSVDFDPGQGADFHTAHVISVFVSKYTGDDLYTGIINGNKDSLLNNILFYPNPTTGKINIQFGKNNENFEISISNSIGQLLESNLYKNVNNINLNISYPKGLYFVTCKTDKGEKYVTKVVKE